MLNKIKEIFAAIGIFLAAAIGVFLLGKNSVPKGLTLDRIKKAKKEVKDEQSKMDVFDKLNNLDDSINNL